MFLPRDTSALFEKHGDKFESRSLWFDRYAEPAAREEDRADFFRRGFGMKRFQSKSEGWQRFLFDNLNLKPEDILFAKQAARLILNASGGVMENAGVCLDRFSGLPYLPGSAIKGCARRMAIESLLDEPSAAKKAAMLCDIALIFGWSDSDWSDRRTRQDTWVSDFKYASENNWNSIRDEAQQMLWNRFRQSMNLCAGFDVGIWKKELHSVAGTVSFLPAYPFRSPNPDMELDILTCHHPQYYNGGPGFENAPDTENPNPVCFPTVAPGHVFAFALLPLRGCDAALLGQAREFLKNGLEEFGLGGKTAAGYGWFDCSDAFQREIVTELRQKRDREEAERRRREEDLKAKVALEEERKRKKELANMTDEERVAALTNERFNQRMIEFNRQQDGMKLALIRELCGSRKDFWLDIRRKAEKGIKKDKARWNPIVLEIFRIAKAQKPSIKMP